MPKVSSYSAVSSVGSGDSIYVIQGGQSRKAVLNVPMQFGGSITLGTDGSNAHLINGTLRLLANTLSPVRIERQGQDKLFFSVGDGSFIDSFNNAESARTLIAITGSNVELWAGPGLTPGISFRATNPANAVNYIEVSGSAVSSAVVIASQGGNGDIPIFYSAKGIGPHSFGTEGGTQVRITNSANTANVLQLTGASSLQPVRVQASGGDSNIGVGLFYKGESNLEIWSYTGAVETAIAFIGSESPVGPTTRRYLSFIGDVGAAINIGGTTSDLLVRNDANAMLQILGVASGANWLAVTQSITGNPVTLAPAGGDSNIALSISGKGTSPVVVQGDLEIRGASAVPNTQSGHYTLVASDANKSIIHPASDNNPRTFTIPANASVPFKIGTMVTFTNHSSSNVTIAINSDTMRLAVTGTTGSRTLAQHGVATALKIDAAEWIISGQGIT